MSEPWYPGATHMPGDAAGYYQGQIPDVAICVCHYTVGRDSTNIGLNGTFPFLVRRNGEVVQFSEVDAVNYHACEWNWLGPGVEVEYLPGQDAEVFTDQALNATGALVKWLNAEWGIPLTYYDGPRLPIGDGYRGFVAHGSLVHHACDQHTDSWPREDWDAMIEEGFLMALTDQQQLDVWNVCIGLASGVNPGQPETPLDTTARLQRIEDKPGGGGLSEADIRRIIDEQVAVQLAKKEWR